MGVQIVKIKMNALLVPELTETMTLIVLVKTHIIT